MNILFLRDVVECLIVKNGSHKGISECVDFFKIKDQDFSQCLRVIKIYKEVDNLGGFLRRQRRRSRKRVDDRVERAMNTSLCRSSQKKMINING